MKLRFRKRAIVLLSILGPAVIALGKPQSSQPASDSVALTNATAANFSSEVAAVTAALKEKFDANKTAVTNLSENIKAINDLIARHQPDNDREQLGRLYLLDAHIYADGLKDTGTARVLWASVVKAFPGTEAARGAKACLARLDAELAAKAALQFPEVKGPLPVLVLPSLNVGLQTFDNVIITNVATTNISFAHTLGSGNAGPESLAPMVKRQLAAALFAINRPLPENGRPEIAVPEIYARSFLNQPAPRFVAEDWITPAPNTLGKFVLIEFWATWCEPCKGSIGRLNELQRTYQDKLVVIGISGESAAVVSDYYQNSPPTYIGTHVMAWPRIKYSVAVDTHKRMMQSVGVTGIPHSVLIDPRGIVRFEGMPHWLSRDDAGFRRLLAKYSP